MHLPTWHLVPNYQTTRLGDPLLSISLPPKGVIAPQADKTDLTKRAIYPPAITSNQLDPVRFADVITLSLR